MARRREGGGSQPQRAALPVKQVSAGHNYIAERGRRRFISEVK